MCHKMTHFNRVCIGKLKKSSIFCNFLHKPISMWSRVMSHICPMIWAKSAHFLGNSAFLSKKVKKIAIFCTFLFAHISAHLSSVWWLRHIWAHMWSHVVVCEVCISPIISHIFGEKRWIPSILSVFLEKSAKKCQFLCTSIWCVDTSKCMENNKNKCPVYVPWFWVKSLKIGVFEQFCQKNCNFLQFFAHLFLRVNQEVWIKCQIKIEKLLVAQVPCNVPWMCHKSDQKCSKLPILSNFV